MAPPSQSDSIPIVFVCALADEAKHFSLAIERIGKLAVSKSRINFKVVQTGLGIERINQKLNDVCAGPPAALIVAGTAGSLNSEHNAGDIIILSSAVDGTGNSLPLSGDWMKTLLTALASLQPKTGIGFTSPNAVTSSAEKLALHNNYAADCVDMETTMLIQFAKRKNIPVAAFRIIVDPHNQSIPPPALAGLKADGTTNALATAFSLLKHPHLLLHNLKALLALAGQYRLAMKTLAEAARLLTDFLSNPSSAETLEHDHVN